MQLNEKAYEHIRSMLTRGHLRPGNRLVTRTLASEIGVSLGPVREAIQRLATEGFVKLTPGAGAMVHQPGRQELEELYVLRDATESCAAALAAKHASPALLDELESLLEIWEDIAESIGSSGKKHATKKQLDRWLDTEERFHELLMEGSRNRLLSRVIRDHRAISAVFDAQRSNPAILNDEVAQGTIQSKRELIAALRKGDAALARKLMSEQIQRGQKHVLSHWRPR